MPKVTFEPRLAIVIFSCTMLVGAAFPDTDRDLFRESVAAGRNASQEPQAYIFNEIAKAQAKRGYYEDALETSHLVDSYPDQLFVALVEIRAKNGDISGAKNMAVSAPKPEWRLRADESIAILEANAGQLDAANQTSRDLPDKTAVLQAIGIYQAKSGDLEAALKTAEMMKRGWSDEVLSEIAGTLRERGDEKRAREIALRIADPEMSLFFRDPEGWKKKHPDLKQQPANHCQIAIAEAKAGKYVDALKKLEIKGCECNGDEYVYFYAHDAAGAARAARECSNPGDVSYRMAEFAKMSADQGNISEALKFAAFVHVTGADYEEGYLAPALRNIARAWVAKEELSTVLIWARSVPDGYQRSMALLGVAESISSKQDSVLR